MKRTGWKKQHKWFGLIFSFFLLMFCVSGIILNHRHAVAAVNISRKWLPQTYHYRNWNNGLVRGTLECQINGKPAQLLYGTAGIWLTDSAATTFSDFNKGLPEGIDYRNIRNIVQTPSGEKICAGQFALYAYHSPKGWSKIDLPLQEEERLTDLALQGDTLVAAGRSHLYISRPPYTKFEASSLKAPEGYKPQVTLFRTTWTLHSGEAFGVAGKLLVDAIAVIIITLCLTGITSWILPKQIKHNRQRDKDVRTKTRWFKKSVTMHGKAGRWTILFTLFVALTGICLRPPIMIPLVQISTPPIPGTNLDNLNPWNERLRAIRYDHDRNEWLISTTEGFYTLATLQSIPRKEPISPPVSVMGVNVLRQNGTGQWLVGSFSGMYVWDRNTAEIKDYYTHQAPPPNSGAPFGKKAIAGYSDNIAGKARVFEYKNGCGFAPMPPQYATLPISLWNLCVEIHTGRIYTIFGTASIFYIFFAGLVTLWIIMTGYKIRNRHKNKQ